jgi:hypothetical protein
MKGKEPPRPQPGIDPILPKPQIQQLFAGDDPVLTTGDLYDPRLQGTRLTLTAYMAGNVSRVDHRPRMALWA